MKTTTKELSQVTVRVPQDKYRKLKAVLAMRGETLVSFITKKIKEEIGE